MDFLIFGRFFTVRPRGSVIFRIYVGRVTPRRAVHEHISKRPNYVNVPFKDFRGRRNPAQSTFRSRNEWSSLMFLLWILLPWSSSILIVFDYSKVQPPNVSHQAHKRYFFLPILCDWFCDFLRIYPPAPLVVHFICSAFILSYIVLNPPPFATPLFLWFTVFFWGPLQLSVSLCLLSFCCPSGVMGSWFVPGPPLLCPLL